ncbi:MAG: bifunctional DNA-formamidopyrimidine glycosylase/DNA-(apurinic or apyrimidinic site) lyase [Phycisphaerales bacterium]|nr:MAG: bifunctional DNA-formamidopyrimidine glycosylase/DNA-(apurinic or apyrimidinic site) lyase [Phycisphaerales bacterium]
MPELPEVENIAAGLREAIRGEYLERVEVRRPGIIQGPHRRRWRRFLAQVAGRRVARVTRRAKRLIIVTDNRLTLLFQLGMTGKFLLGTKPVEADEFAKHTHVVLHVGDRRLVRFIDARRFGRLWLLDGLDPDEPDEAMNAARMGPLGPEALAMRTDAFRRLLQTERSVKTLLLDQTRIAGLGNIYADEALFAAGIHPTRRCGAISDEVGQDLLRAIKSVLRRAIRAGGTTFSDYRSPYGDMGRFRRRLRVYGRQGEPCRRCGATIEKIVVAGRGTHFCPTCQPVGP